MNIKEGNKRGDRNKVKKGLKMEERHGQISYNCNSPRANPKTKILRRREKETKEEQKQVNWPLKITPFLTKKEEAKNDRKKNTPFLTKDKERKKKKKKKRNEQTEKAHFPFETFIVIHSGN